MSVYRSSQAPATQIYDFIRSFPDAHATVKQRFGLMRILWIAWLFPCALAAQTPQSSPILRGVVLECDQRPAGEIAIRASDNQVLRYQFDRKTYVERDEHMIEPSRLIAGEKVEIVSDRAPGFTLRYARTIHVITPVAPARPPRAGLPRPYNPRTDTVRTGTLTYSGVIYRISTDKFVLHTREAGDLSILLRNDTRYLQDGQVVDLPELKLNTRVFVRAGKDLYNEVEAYQVIWGKILAPPQ
jgi:hypothetical protein